MTEPHIKQANFKTPQALADLVPSVLIQGGKEAKAVSFAMYNLCLYCLLEELLWLASSAF